MIVLNRIKRTDKLLELLIHCKNSNSLFANCHGFVKKGIMTFSIKISICDIQ